DYLVKPFAIEELTARMRALGRREQPQKSATLHVADLALDTAAKVAQRGDHKIELTAKEYAILEMLMRNPGQVLSRDQIIDHVWNMDYDGESKLIEVYIYNLRKKIDNDFPQKLLQTVRGLGYRIRNHETTT
ncbi:MAG: response regulator transcription factor, partial [Caldilineaceae bacterium]|nr:response regulator transcription factor [Caldilineaceae bacterium]